MAESRKEQARSLNDISWRGKTIPIKSEKIRVAILGLREQEQELSQAEIKSKSKSEIVEMYDKLFIAYNDAIKVIRDELQSLTSKGSTSQKATDTQENLQFLQSYVNFLKLKKTIERNLILVDMYKQRLDGATADGKRTKPDDLVRLYETLIQNFTEMAGLPGTDSEYSKEIAAKILSNKAFRCYYVALSYAAIAKFGEAIALYNVARSKHIPMALTHHQECKNIDKDEIQKLKELDQTIRSQQSLTHAQAFIKQTVQPEQQKQKLKEKEKTKRGRDYN